LSHPSELRLRLRWVAILSNQIQTDLAITGGVHTAEDVLKSLMAGAKAAMMTSALLEHGVEHLKTVLKDIRLWMEEQEYRSLSEISGLVSQEKVADPSALERANYMNVLKSRDF
jgi:dihydroorotate dehydrogenase (fumarate)